MPHGEDSLTPREGFVAIRLFLEQFYARAGNDLETLIADITLEADGMPGDPAAWDDWTECVRTARGEPAGQ